MVHQAVYAIDSHQRGVNTVKRSSFFYEMFSMHLFFSKGETRSMPCSARSISAALGSRPTTLHQNAWSSSPSRKTSLCTISPSLTADASSACVLPARVSQHILPALCFHHQFQSAFARRKASSRRQDPVLQTRDDQDTPPPCRRMPPSLATS